MEKSIATIVGTSHMQWDQVIPQGASIPWNSLYCFSKNVCFCEQRSSRSRIQTGSILNINTYHWFLFFFHTKNFMENRSTWSFMCSSCIFNWVEHTPNVLFLVSTLCCLSLCCQSSFVSNWNFQCQLYDDIPWNDSTARKSERIYICNLSYWAKK